ncbi:P-loop containing protein [Fusarium pseudocircinatum]|uniref:P-loop containing protein n=1 Tax=Fusarium pseudocircinatum TaxID=56676 RepID=A0A8H5UYN8_9HYPO|nr:P-loop containing protein [Fusarium pseudocircinatum]
MLTTPDPDTATMSKDDEDYVAVPLVDEHGRNAAGGREVVIAVMGNTGSGKSSLIKLISGQEVEVGNGLEACTETVTAVRMDYKRVKLTLLDSPGFNDTYRSETEILKSISSFLSETYSHGFQLSGIIYLHPISNTRMEGSARLSLRMFRKLVGDDSLSNVILSTTHWSRVSPEEGTRREADLQDKFWKDFLDKGAAMMRHTGERDSALALIDALIEKAPVVLDIQHELVDEGKALIDTAAGSELNKELLELQHRYESDLREVRKEMDIAIRENDQRNKSELDEIRQKLDNQLADAKRNQASLRERERVASRDRQRMQSQIQILQMAFDKEKEELKKKFNYENERLTSKLKEAQAASEQAANSEFWSNVTDITNNFLNGFFVLLSAYARK